MISLNVSYLSDSELVSRACSFAKDNNLSSIPINIEHVIEFNYGMDIVPTPGVLDLADTDGYCSSDYTAIYVDEFIYKKRYFRYRFTLAHEIGHRVLHEPYFSKLEFSSVSEWAHVIDQIDPWDYSKMEYQAYTFAGLILVPQEFLEVEFEKQLQLLVPQIEQAQSNGLGRGDYTPTVLDGIAYELSRTFEASIDVLSRRIKFERLEEKIP